MGFEPTNGGFADLSLGPLGYRAEERSITKVASGEWRVASGERGRGLRTEARRTVARSFGSRGSGQAKIVPFMQPRDNHVAVRLGPGRNGVGRSSRHKRSLCHIELEPVLGGAGGCPLDASAGYGSEDPPLQKR